MRKPRPKRGSVRKLPADAAIDPSGPRLIPLREQPAKPQTDFYVTIADHAIRVWGREPDSEKKREP